MWNGVKVQFHECSQGNFHLLLLLLSAWGNGITFYIHANISHYAKLKKKTASDPISTPIFFQLILNSTVESLRWASCKKMETIFCNGIFCIARRKKVTFFLHISLWDRNFLFSLHLSSSFVIHNSNAFDVKCKHRDPFTDALSRSILRYIQVGWWFQQCHNHRKPPPTHSFTLVLVGILLLMAHQDLFCHLWNAKRLFSFPFTFALLVVGDGGLDRWKGGSI